jgi:hypothetical protein
MPVSLCSNVASVQRATIDALLERRQTEPVQHPNEASQEELEDSLPLLGAVRAHADRTQFQRNGANHR